MSELLHAPIKTAFAGHALTLFVGMPRDMKLHALTLHYETQKAERAVEMEAVSTDLPYYLYRATIKGEDMAGETLTYAFVCDGKRCEEYCVPICEMPALPPFVITEFATQMRGDANYYEFCNPSNDAVDLYDFELLLEKEGEIAGRNPLADRAGVNLLAGGEVVVFCFLCAKRLSLYGDAESDVRAMWEMLSSRFPVECGDLLQNPPRLLTAYTAQKTEQGWADMPHVFSITRDEPHRLLVVPRGKGAADAVYVMSVNGDSSSRDVPARTTSLWTIDFCDPKHPYRTHTRRHATPGKADSGQIFPNVKDTTAPLVLPLSPLGVHTLTENEITLRFGVVGEVGRVEVGVITPNGTVRLDAKPAFDGVLEASVDTMLLSGLPKRLSYFVTVEGALYRTALGSEKHPISIKLTDKVGPIVTEVSPADAMVLESEDDVTVRVSFFDVSSVDVATSALFFDGLNVSQKAKWRRNGVTFVPEKALRVGEHVIELTLRDLVGNRSYHRSAFRIVAAGTRPNLYIGEVHSHTIESDGTGTPEQAMAYARDVGHVDYFAVTDHCCYLTLEDIKRQKKVADSFNENGKFAALYGYEASWGEKGFWGHMNILGNKWFAAADKYALYDIYNKLTADTEAIAMFNHPCDRWGDFDSFGGYTKERDDRVCLAEIKREEFDPFYALALSRGWHVAPVSNEDTHHADWTTRTDGTGVVLAHALTRENVMDAFRRGRTYSTMDNTMKIYFSVNGKWMGARLQAPKKLLAEIEITTEREEGIGTVSLVAEDNIVVARLEADKRRAIKWKVELSPDFDYYYVKVQNGNVYSVTSPVYIEGRDAITIVDMKAGVSKNAAKPHAVTVTVQNTGKTTLSAVGVDFYLTPTDGFLLGTRAPRTTVQIGALKAGETRTVTKTFPNVKGNRRLSAVAYGTVGKSRFVDTHYLLLAPALITKILPLSSVEAGVKNPFPYLELYNHTAASLSLDGYFLKVRHLAGDHRPNSYFTLPLDGYKLSAHGTLVIWQRPVGTSLTAADFNLRYGTAFVAGEDVLITEQPFLIPDDAGHLVDLCYGDETLTRATYGDYCGGSVASKDKAELYVYASDMTVREKRFARAAATPGKVLRSQTLHLMTPDRKTKKQAVTEHFYTNLSANTPSLYGKGEEGIIQTIFREPKKK